MQTDCIMWSSCCFEHDGLVGFRAIWQLQAQKFKSAPVEVVSQREPWGVMRWGEGWAIGGKVFSLISQQAKQEETRHQRRPSWKKRFFIALFWLAKLLNRLLRRSKCYLAHLIKSTLNNNSIAALLMVQSCFSKMKMRWEMLWKVQNLLPPFILS